MSDVYGLSPQEVAATVNMMQQLRQQPLDEAYKRALTESALAGAEHQRASTGQMPSKLAIEQGQLGVQQGQLGVAQRNVATHEALAGLQQREFDWKKELDTEMQPLRRQEIAEKIKRSEMQRQALTDMESVPVDIGNGNVTSLGKLEAVNPGFASAFIRTQAGGMDEKGALTANTLNQAKSSILAKYGKNLGGQIYGGFEEMQKQAAAGNQDAIADLENYKDFDTQYNALIAAGRSKMGGSSKANTGGAPPTGWKPMYKPGVGTFYLSPDGKQAWMNGKLVQ